MKIFAPKVSALDRFHCASILQVFHDCIVNEFWYILLFTNPFCRANNNKMITKLSTITLERVLNFSNKISNFYQFRALRDGTYFRDGRLFEGIT